MFATPSAADSQGTTGGGQGRSLRTDVRMFPTATASRGGYYTKRGVKVPKLAGIVGLLPTPRERDWRGMSQRGIHKPSDALLNAVVASGMLPTPTGNVSEKSHNQTSGAFRDGMRKHGVVGALNPAWVEALMGLPVGWTDIPYSPKNSIRSLEEHAKKLRKRLSTAGLRDGMTGSRGSRSGRRTDPRA